VLDGAGRWGIFWRIVLPMSRGPLITIALTTTVWAWKDFLWPLLVAAKSRPGTHRRPGDVPAAIPQHQPDWTGLMAGSPAVVLRS